MTHTDGLPTGSHTPSADALICRDSIERSLLDVAVRAVHQRDCADLDHLPVLGRHPGLAGQQRTGYAMSGTVAPVPAVDVDRIDAEAVAAWIVGQYPEPTYPGVIVGSPHGGTVHLAAAVRAPWLPSGFTVTVEWPGGAADDWHAALDHGAAVAARILAANPMVAVRQVHDPLVRGPSCGSTVTLHVRWRRLPAAYRAFLGHRLERDAAILVTRDARTWPILDLGNGHTFQLGSPVGGWGPADYTVTNPAFAHLLTMLGGGSWAAPSWEPVRRYAEHGGEPELERDLRRVVVGTGRPAHRALYPNPEALSACVADLYRDWLFAEGRGGDRCIVETERLIDPWQVLTAGLVPYWCESASARSVAGAEWWLAGSSRFTSVDVLPAPPGTVCDAYAQAAQWRSVASFGSGRGQVDPEGAGRYPLLPLPTCHAARVLRSGSRHLPSPVPLRMSQVLSGLRRTGEALGLLVL